MNRPSSADSTGVLTLAHGSVENLDDLPAFVTRIRRGRPPPPGLLDELRERYRAIGGSPFLEMTRAQAAALEAALGLPVLVGMRLSEPSVEQAFRAAAERGLSRLVLLPLAPYSVHIYNRAAHASLQALRDELGGAVPELLEIDPWGAHPEFIAAQARSIESALNGRPSSTAIIVTAHSLPNAVIRAGDPYADQFGASAGALSARLGRRVHLAYQSQGADGGDWLGPTLQAMLETARREGATDVVVAPVGFVSEHVETLYDLDIEARGQAEALGLAFHRVATLQTDPQLMSALAQLVSARIAA